MDIKPIPTFKPLIPHHCITDSLRHRYKFHHYPISEDLLLGVGAGRGSSLFTEAANTPNPTDTLHEASTQLLAIAACEQAAWEQLQRLVG